MSVEEGRGGALEWHAGDMPYSQRFGDHYYSKDDGRAECAHVFMAGNGLPDRWTRRETFTIAELGFGTGLNMMETWRVWKSACGTGQKLRLVSIEAFPLTAQEMARALAAWPEISAQAERLVAAWPNDPADTTRIDIALDDTADLTVLVGCADTRIADVAGPVDAWYLDGFAPSRNPEMWSETLLDQVFALTAKGGSFATYTAAGWVRRNLQESGFHVEKRPGFADKREMLSGVRRG